MWAAKVTPLLGLSWEPLLLLLPPPSEFLLIMPGGSEVTTVYKGWSEYCNTAILLLDKSSHLDLHN